jgi:Bacterial SH3 domain
MKIAALTLALAAALPSWAASDTRYVLAHRVNLRDAPSSTAAVVARLDIATAVTLARRSGDWCEISLAPREGATVRSGFVACTLLAESPPRIEALDKERLAPWLPPAARLRLDERAFWLSPSLARWGDFANDQPLIESGATLERPQDARIVPSDSFAASLALLRSGSLVVHDLVAGEAGPHVDLADVLHAAPLPPARASWFKQGDIDAVLPSGSAENNNDVSPNADPTVLWHAGLRVLDALAWRAKSRVTATADSAWNVGHDQALHGVAGIGALRVTFEPAASFHEIALDGAAHTRVVGQLQQQWPLDDCQLDTATLLRPDPHGDATSARVALVAWVGTRPPAAKARLAVRRGTLRERDQDVAVTLTEVDLDGDGRPDFVVHEWFGGPEHDQETIRGRAVHANIDGAWRRMFVFVDRWCDS